jgi:hypothetical protein
MHARTLEMVCDMLAPISVWLRLPSMSFWDGCTANIIDPKIVKITYYAFFFNQNLHPPPRKWCTTLVLACINHFVANLLQPSLDISPEHVFFWMWHRKTAFSQREGIVIKNTLCQEKTISNVPKWLETKADWVLMAFHACMRRMMTPDRR